jgi:hypothetical protein
VALLDSVAHAALPYGREVARDRLSLHVPFLDTDVAGENDTALRKDGRRTTRGPT